MKGSKEKDRMGRGRQEGREGGRKTGKVQDAGKRARGGDQQAREGLSKKERMPYRQ